jgi:hypothetical protein
VVKRRTGQIPPNCNKSKGHTFQQGSENDSYGIKLKYILKV